MLRKRVQRLVNLAVERRPELIVLVDFDGFNRRFAKTIRQRQTVDWTPRIVRYVSPQVWASRAGRAKALARDIDLLLCLFPFEKQWYAQRFPQMKVEVVGPPIFDRYADDKFKIPKAASADGKPLVVLLPGSRKAELKRHLPVMYEALQLIAQKQEVRYRVVLPEGVDIGGMFADLPPTFLSNVQNGGLADALREASIAISKTGTITLECAFFGVPTVAIYKTSWLTALIARLVIKVNFLAMPNLLANEPVFPELLQQKATPQRIASEALNLLHDETRRTEIKRKLQTIIAQLGGVGSTERAATAVINLIRG
jgi:lipid-A-disaccharide synthase